MFGNRLFESLFRDPFLQSGIDNNRNQRRSSSVNRSSMFDERCSVPKPRDLFTEFSRMADQLFTTATRSLLQAHEMFPGDSMDSFSNTWRGEFLPRSNAIDNYGVNHEGNLVDLRQPNSRGFRHLSTEPVRFHRTRLQWYDSNTRRALYPTPSPPRYETNGRLLPHELSKLPLSTYRIKPGQPRSNEVGSDLETPVAVNNCASELSPGTAYLQPVSRTPCVVEIKPLQSSPTRGQPECAVCLTEYRNKDQLRHLPCGHAFHSKCIDVWFRESSTCPKCRAGVRTGIKRLERELHRSRQQRNRPPAPVRAIRQIKSKPPTPKTQNTVGTSDGAHRSRPEATTSRYQQQIPGSSDLPITHAFQNITIGRGRTNQSAPRMSISTAAQTSGSRRPATDAELSSLARRKAAEAAIKRAEEAAIRRAEEAAIKQAEEAARERANQP